MKTYSVQLSTQAQQNIKTRNTDTTVADKNKAKNARKKNVKTLKWKPQLFVVCFELLWKNTYKHQTSFNMSN